MDDATIAPPPEARARPYVRPLDFKRGLVEMGHGSGGFAYLMLARGGTQILSRGFDPVALVEAIPGHMREVVIGKQHLADNHRHLYEQLATYTRGCGKPETAKGRAAHLCERVVRCDAHQHVDAT